jgi:hypothetical protein
MSVTPAPEKPDALVWFFFLVVAFGVIGTIAVVTIVKGTPPPTLYSTIIIVVGVASDFVGTYFLVFTKQKVFGFFCVFYGAVLIGIGTILTGFRS